MTPPHHRSPPRRRPFLRRRLLRSLLLLAGFALVSGLAACSGGRAARRAGGPPHASPGESERGAVDDVFGTVVVRDLDDTFLTLLALLGAPIPAGGADEMKTAFVTALGGNEALARAIDGRRPAALAVLDPERHGRAGRPPLVLALPVVSRQEATSALAQRFAHAGSEGGEERFQLGGGQIHVAYARPQATGANVAFLAFGPRVARPVGEHLARLLAAPQSDLAVWMSLRRIARRHGAQLEMVLGHLATMWSSEGVGARARFGLRSLEQVTAHLAHAASLELDADVNEAGLDLAVRLVGRGGPWADFLAAQRPGPIWGAHLVPEDALLVYATHRRPEHLGRESAALTACLVEQVGPVVATPAITARWSEALDGLFGATQGDLVYAVWPAGGKGLGAGGAFRIAAGAGGAERARAASLAAYSALGDALAAMIVSELGLAKDKVAFEASVKKGATRAGGVTVDVIEFSPRWSGESDEERRVFTWLFGDRLRLGLAFVGEHALFASGRDFRERLQTMVRAARGENVRSIVDRPGFARVAHAHRGTVTLSYVPTEPLARFVGRVVSSLTPPDKLDPAHETMLLPFYGESQAEAAITAQTWLTDGERPTYHFSTHLPPVAVSELGRIGGAMWRVALSPVLGPPALPPLPTPPPHITPTPGQLGGNDRPSESEPPAQPPAQPIPPSDNLPKGRGA